MKQIIKIEFECLCNLDCEYCFRRGKKYEASVEKVRRQIDSIFEIYNPMNTYFRVEGIGEITLYPQIISYLNKKAKELYLIEVLSNGVLTEVIKNNANLKWIISLDGHTVEMNKLRNLNEKQIDSILDIIINLNLEVQCVFSDQTIDEMNAFIQYLQLRNYKGFLHIFPRKFADRRNDKYLDYNKLVKATFIPDIEYFERWKYIYENQKRNFVCDFFKVGYVYRIMQNEGKIKKIKCDCGSFMFEDEQRIIYDNKNCSTCINHFEYDMRRKAWSR
jgi:MoaA/NifB/PqqE/SkfB family radical SAM enzyme